MRANSGENHWRWKGGLVTKQCKVCGSEFSSKESAKRLYCSLECVYKTTRGVPNRNSQWKGDDASYTTLHTWVARWRGKPSKCEECGDTTKRKYEWANISKEYKRDLSDWKRLCHPCHIKFDDSISKAVLTRKLKKETHV